MFPFHCLLDSSMQILCLDQEDLVISIPGGHSHAFSVPLFLKTGLLQLTSPSYPATDPKCSCITFFTPPNCYTTSPHVRSHSFRFQKFQSSRFHPEFGSMSVCAPNNIPVGWLTKINCLYLCMTAVYIVSYDRLTSYQGCVPKL